MLGTERQSNVKNNIMPILMRGPSGVCNSNSTTIATVLLALVLYLSLWLSFLFLSFSFSIFVIYVFVSLVCYFLLLFIACFHSTFSFLFSLLFYLSLVCFVICATLSWSVLHSGAGSLSHSLILLFFLTQALFFVSCSGNSHFLSRNIPSSIIACFPARFVY